MFNQPHEPAHPKRKIDREAACRAQARSSPRIPSTYLRPHRVPLFLNPVRPKSPCFCHVKTTESQLMSPNLLAGGCQRWLALHTYLWY